MPAPAEPKDVLPREMYAKHYGSVVVLDAVQRTLGIEDDLRKVFGDLTPNILACAMAQVMEPSVMDEVHQTVEESVLGEYLCLRGDLSPATLSDLTKEVGSSLALMDDFFDLRMERDKGRVCVFDVTSVSTYSDVGGWGEYGYNRDGEDLKQLGWLIITGSDGIVKAFVMLPGSVSDISTLRTVVATFRDKMLDGDALFDRGFESAANVGYLLKEGISFVTPSNLTAKAVKTLLSENYKTVRAPENQSILDGERYGHMTCTIGVIRQGDDEESGYAYVGEGEEGFEESMKLSAHIIYDPRAEVKANDSLMTEVLDLQEELKGMKIRQAKKLLAERRSAVVNALSLEPDKDGNAVPTVNYNSIAFSSNRAGIFILLTPEGKSWDEAMISYGVRNEVEEAYDAYKNDLDGNRVRTGDPDRARGRFFIRFLALMMICFIRRRLRKYSESLLPKQRKDDKVHKMSVREVIRSLNTVIAVGSTGHWSLTHVTKTNRQISGAFGLSPMSSGKVVLGRLDQVCAPIASEPQGSAAGH